MGDADVEGRVVAVVDKSLIDDDDVLLFSFDVGVVQASSFVTVSTVVPDSDTKLDW